MQQAACWDADKTRMEMHGLISTSNILESDEIHVDTDQELIWMTAQKGEGELDMCFLAWADAKLYVITVMSPM